MEDGVGEFVSKFLPIVHEYAKVQVLLGIHMHMMPCAKPCTVLLALTMTQFLTLAWRKASYTCVFLVTPILWHIHVLLEEIQTQICGFGLLESIHIPVSSSVYDLGRTTNTQLIKVEQPPHNERLPIAYLHFHNVRYIMFTPQGQGVQAA